jgi:tetratricopeptide (TPR) repeat protein
MKRENSTAAIYFERALAVKKDPVLLFKLGTIYERQKEYEKAAGLSEELIHQFPEFYLGYNQLAWIYAVQEIHLDKALTYAKKANELNPANPVILDTLGWVYYKKKNYDKASEYLEKAVAAESASPEINYHLGASYYAEGKTDLAKKYLGIALNQSPAFDNADDAHRILKLIKKNNLTD